MVATLKDVLTSSIISYQIYFIISFKMIKKYIDTYSYLQSYGDRSVTYTYFVSL